MSMTSDANRRYVLEAWNTVVEKVGIRTGINYVEEEPVYLGNTKEEKAQIEIKDKLNIKPMHFDYLPTDWKFSSYEVNEEAGYAIFLYSDGENWMHVLMKKNEDYVENVTYFQLDRDITKVGEIVNGQNIKIDLYTDREQSYIAILEKDANYYRINVKISYEEMVNILKYTAF